MSPFSPTRALLVQLEPNWKKITRNKNKRKVRLEGGNGTIFSQFVDVSGQVLILRLEMVIKFWVSNNDDCYPFTISMKTSGWVKGIPLLYCWGAVSTSFLVGLCPLSMGEPMSWSFRKHWFDAHSINTLLYRKYVSDSYFSGLKLNHIWRCLLFEEW